MLDLAKVLAVFGLVLLLLRFKWNLGAVMLTAAGALGLLTGLAPLAILDIAYRSSVDKSGLSLILALALIMVLENLLRTTETLKKLVASLKGLLGDNRVVMGLMPAIIGILPSPGGAYFSAPLVEESSTGCEVSSERKSFINHWFRHVWEYISPLYPGFILTAAVTGVSYGRLFLYTAVFPVTVVIVGVAFAFRDVKTSPAPAMERSRREDLTLAAVSFSPILASMLLVMVFKVNIAVAMIIVVTGLFAYFRYTPAKIYATLKDSLSLKTLLLVLGVLIFKGMVEGSGVVRTLPAFFESSGIPVEAILFLLPFMVGLMTGIVIAYVGITLPMILPLIGGHDPDMGMLAFAYASGFAGVMFSPVHLCLVLTKDYFKSELAPIYRLMLIPEAIVVGVGFIQMMLT